MVRIGVMFIAVIMSSCGPITMNVNRSTTIHSHITHCKNVKDESACVDEPLPEPEAP